MSCRSFTSTLTDASHRLPCSADSDLCVRIREDSIFPVVDPDPHRADVQAKIHLVQLLIDLVVDRK